MSAPTTGRWRSLRASAFALIAAQIAIAGHLIAGGRLPDLTLLVSMSVLLAACLTGLGRRRRGFGQLLPAMAITQVVFHLILTVSGDRHAAPADSHPWRMWIFHAAAAVVSTALLAHGERVLFALHSWWSRLLPTTADLTSAVCAAVQWVAVIDRQGERLRDRLTGAARSVRGPPRIPASHR